MEEFNKLEREVLNWIKNHNKDKLLKNQIDSAKFIEREWTKVGYYVELEVEKIITKLELETKIIDGPFIKSAGIENCGGSIIFVEDGFIKCIEMFSYGDRFDKEILNYELTDKL